MLIADILTLPVENQIKILTKAYPDTILNAVKEYDGEHKILNRAPKIAGPENNRREIPQAKLVLKLQKKIVNSSVFFLFGGGTRLVMKNLAPEQSLNDAYDYLVAEWDKAKLDTINKNLARRLLIETRAATLFYQAPIPENEKLPGGPAYRTRARLLCLENGDYIYPHFDDLGDMDAFTRRFTRVDVNDDGSEVKIDTLEIYTAEQKVTNTLEGTDWVTKTEVNPFKKIPVVYYEIQAPDWNDVQGLIEKLEDRLSKFDDTNDYFASPAVKIRGEIINAPEKEEVGKLFQLKQGTGGTWGDVEYLTWDQTPEAIKLEIELLREFVHSISDTPDLSFDKLQGVAGKLSGVAMRFLFMSATQKAIINRDMFDDGMTRRISVLKAMLAFFDAKKALALGQLKVEVAYNEPLPIDETEVISNLVSAVQAGIMSKKTAVMLNPMVEDAIAELEEIEEEASKGESFTI